MMLSRKMWIGGGAWPLRLRLSKKLKFVAVGGHAPTTVTPTGKFYGKLCARSKATSARFAVKFCRRGYTRGNSRVRQLPCAAVAPCAACRVSRHAEAEELGPSACFYCNSGTGITMFTWNIWESVEITRLPSYFCTIRRMLSIPYPWSPLLRLVVTGKPSRISSLPSK